MTEIYEICFEMKNVLLPENYILNNEFCIFWYIVYWLLDSVYHFDRCASGLRAVFGFEHR